MRKFAARISLSWILFVSLLLFLFVTPRFVLAQDDDGTFSIANYLPILDTDVKDGSLVSFSPQGYFLSKKEYDTFLIGVVTTSPAIALEIEGEKKSYPVVSTGDTPVLVSTINGAIKKGDPITSSSLPGVGMKSAKSGYIMGVALEDFSSNNPREIKAIPVRLNIHYYVVQSGFNIGLLDVLNLSKLATYEEPIKAFKYVVAGTLVILSFIMSFFIFARTANKGIEALGRNPLASRMIQLGILLNVAIAISIIAAGIFIAFLVLRL